MKFVRGEYLNTELRKENDRLRAALAKAEAERDEAKRNHESEHALSEVRFRRIKLLDTELLEEVCRPCPCCKATAGPRDLAAAVLGGFTYTALRDITRCSDGLEDLLGRVLLMERLRRLLEPEWDYHRALITMRRRLKNAVEESPNPVAQCIVEWVGGWWR